MWTEKILIVGDNLAMNQMLEASLQREGVVEVVLTEEHALFGIDRDYCAAVVVNGDSRNIDVISLYEKAIGLYPSIKNRFLFVTFSNNSKHQAYFDRNGLKCVQGPGAVKDAVNEIISSQRL
jgi:hypothetical protein